MGEKLTEAQIDRAYRLYYGDGLSLGHIMAELGCGLYDLSPWLTAPAARIAASAIQGERDRADQPSHYELRHLAKVASEPLPIGLIGCARPVADRLEAKGYWTGSAYDWGKGRKTKRYSLTDKGRAALNHRKEGERG